MELGEEEEGGAGDITFVQKGGPLRFPFPAYDGDTVDDGVTAAKYRPLLARISLKNTGARGHTGCLTP